MVAASLGFLISGCEPASQPSQSRPQDQLRSAAEAAVKEKLKDPNSAEFRYKGDSYDIEHKLICGEVNARNSFGGYTGFEGYVYDDGHVSLQSDDHDGWIDGMTKCTAAIQDQTRRDTTAAIARIRNTSDLTPADKADAIRGLEEVRSSLDNSN